MRRLRIILAVVTGLGLAATSPSVDRAGGQGTTLTLATGPGISTMVGFAMQSMVNDFVSGGRASTETADSEEQVLQWVSSGRATLGLATIPEIARAFPTAEARDRSGLSFVMGGHAAIVAHVFVREDLPNPSLAGLQGRRVALPEPGAPGEALARAVLEVHGLTGRAIKPVYARIEEQVKAFETGFVDAVILAVPVPSPVVASPAPTALAASGKARLVALDASAIAALLGKFPGYSRHTIQPGTYAGQAGAVATVASKNAIVARKDADPGLVYRFAKTILENPGEFAKRCPLAVAYTPHNILPESPLLPLHSGAERYYRDRGIF